MENQEVLDIVTKHLFAQGERAVDGYYCTYFNKDTGRKCAVGCLIPEELYASEMEGLGVDELCHGEDILPVGKYLVDNFDLGFLEALQGIHDLASTEDFISYITTKLSELAKHHKLIWEAP